MQEAPPEKGTQAPGEGEAPKRSNPLSLALELARTTSGAVSPEALAAGWFSVEALAAEIADTFERRADRAFRAAFHARCPTPGSTPDDFGLRRVARDGPEGFAFHAAIRFKGVDPSRPFVEVEAVEGWPSGSFDDALDALLETFAVFEPRAVRFIAPRVPSRPESASPGQPASIPRWNVTLDVGIHAGPLESIARLAERTPGTLTLERVDPGGVADHFPWYAELYEDLWRSRPNFRGNVPCETLDTLEECAAAGAFFLVYVDGRRAGVMAARPEGDSGFEGWMVVEEILEPRVRGRGLGVSVQKALARELLARKSPARESKAGEPDSALAPLPAGRPPCGPLLIGHIHRENAASRANAIRCGRPIVCERHFATPAGRPVPWI